MDDAIQVFNFGDLNIRTTVDEQGKPLFVAKDVALALGYKDAVNAIKQHCRGVAFHDPLESKGVAKHHPLGSKGVSNRYPLQTAGGTQDFRMIYEPDVYRLIIKSRLPSAEKFESWVFEEVLPSIRKTGGYQFKNQQSTDQPKPLPMIIGPLEFELYEGELRLRDQQLVDVADFFSPAVMRRAIRTRIDKGIFSDREVVCYFPPHSVPKHGEPPMYFMFSHTGVQKFLADLRSPKAKEMALHVASVCAQHGQVIPFKPRTIESKKQDTPKITKEDLDATFALHMQAPDYVKAYVAAVEALGLDIKEYRRECLVFAKEKTGLDMLSIMDA